MVTRDPTIPKHAVSQVTDFERLRALGSDYVRDLASDQWTDYNEHDPGITLLEALSYVLTDVLYRAKFPVADFLVNRKGVIDWHRQALHPAEEALPCRPTTELDYRTVLLDQVHEAENLRFEKVTADGDPNGPPTGLYRVFLRLKPNTIGTMGPAMSRATARVSTQPDHEQVKLKVYTAFSSVRNLCEDIESIEVAPTSSIELQADVEIAAGTDPAAVLARIYQTCAAYLAAGVEFKPYDLALRDGMTPEEIFRGPFAAAGMVTNSVRASKTSFLLPDIYAQINSVGGVERVTFPPEAQEFRSDQPLQLHWPTREDDIKVRLFNNGKRLRVMLHELNMRFEELNFANRGMRFDANSKHPVPRPTGIIRNLVEYKSVQFELPPIYGVGARGVPDSAKMDRKVSAHQLRGYLLLFDQHVADLLAMLGRIRDLYSLDVRRLETYFFQLLEDANFPGIDQAGTSEDFQRTLERSCLLDDNNHRADRILDYLVALYGEQFRQDPKFHFSDSVAGRQRQASFSGHLGFLEEIVRITRDRAAATDYMEDTARAGNCSGLETKLNYLLGYGNALHGRGGVRVIEHMLLRTQPATGQDWFRISVFLAGWKAPWNDVNFRRIAAEELAACCPAHVNPDVYWLDAAQMEEFDGLEERWLTSRRKAIPSLLHFAEEHSLEQDPPSGMSSSGSDGSDEAPVSGPVGPESNKPDTPAYPRTPRHAEHVARRHTAKRELEENARPLREFIEGLKKGAEANE